MERKKLHIVQVSLDETVFVNDTGSDTRQRQLGYAAELERQAPGSLMTMIVLVQSPCFFDERELNLRIVPLPFRGRLTYALLFFRLLQLHREEPIHVITCQDVAGIGWWVLFFGLIKRIPVAGQIHYDFFSSSARRDCFGNNLKGWLHYQITLRLLPFFSSFRVVGRRIQNKMLERGIRRHVALIPVPVTMLEGCKSDYSEGVTKRQSLVLFVGRLVYQKNLFLWMEVAARVCKFSEMARFRIIGEGPLKNKLREESIRLGIAQRVEFMGEVPYAQLDDHYKKASVFLLTSFYEGFGRVVVESYAHWLPVVATKITGVEDIVDHEKTGFLHGIDEVEKLAQSTLLLLNDADLREKMGSAGFKKVCAQFEPSRLSREWVSFLIETINRQMREKNR